MLMLSGHHHKYIYTAPGADGKDLHSHSFRK